MKREQVQKIARFFIAAIFFLSLVQVIGFPAREAQQLFFICMVVTIFGFLLGNIWISMFLWWTVFLTAHFKFQVSSTYLINVFCGCVLYYTTKAVAKKEHIEFFLNTLLWLVAINLGLMILQLFGLDFINKLARYTTEGFKGFLENYDPAGFMGYKGAMGCLMACAVPVLASRPGKWGLILAVALFLPLYLSKAAICIAGGLVAFLFVLWYKDLGFSVRGFYISSRAAWLSVLLVLVISGLCYMKFTELPMGNSIPQRLNQWKLVARDCVMHPIIGWGPDSFRNETERKKFVYAMSPNLMKDGGVHYSYWDNPHNLLISLFYEWGVIGLLILLGYFRFLALAFQKSIKDPEILALSGVILAVLVVSMAQFPMFLARCVCFIIPLAALFEVKVK